MSLIDQYAEAHFVLNNISEVRQRRNIRLLRRTEEWLGRPPSEMTPDDVRRWMTERVAEGKHVNTVRFELMMLRPFWRWAWQAGHIPADRFTALREIPPPRGASANGEPKPYRRAEIAKLWQEIEAAYPRVPERVIQRWERRHKHKRPTPWRKVAPEARRLQLEAIVSLALYCGLRRSEIFRLSLDDLHPDNAYLVVRGKRTDHHEKVRPVPYNDAAREAVTRWLEFRRMMRLKHRSPWVRCTVEPHWRKPMWETQFNSLLNRLGTGWKFHRLRHTCATERLRAGMPLEVLMRFLGHSNIQQTLEYAKIVAKDIEVQARQSDAAFIRAIGKPSDEQEAA